ncbi:MAG: PAS domain S-box protein [Anaerolineae bacterium]|nr:PAS domain S-box protein [Anaerolineae bacterium]
MKFIQKVIQPPVFDDEEKTHQAYLLNIILWALIVVPLPYLLYILFAQPEMAARAWVQTIVGETVNIFLLFLLRRGHVRTASLIQTLAFWLFFTATAFTAYGVQDESYLFGYPLVILIAGLLLGTRAAASFTVLCLLSGLGMVYSLNIGLIEVPENRSVLFTWVLSLIIFPIFTTVQYLTWRTVSNALTRAQRSEEKYKLISRVSSDYAFESRINRDGVAETIWLGGAFEKMTGYTPEEYFAAGGWYAHVHPDDLEQDNIDMMKLFNNEVVQGSEIRTFAKNGEIRWERVFAHPIWSREENRLIGILGAVQDITEQKQAEEKLQKIYLQQEAILNNIPDMAWLKDTESRYIAVNEQFLRICELNYEDIIGKTDDEIWDEAYAQKYRADDLDVIQSGTRKTVEELQKDGTGREYWVETTKTPIYNEQRLVIGTTGIAREITQRKLAEISDQIRREMLEKVVQLGKRVTEVSDLKTTLEKIWHGVHDDLDFDRLGIFLYNAERNSMDSALGTDIHGQIQDTRGQWFPLEKFDSFNILLKQPDGLYFTHNYTAENNIPPGHEMYGVNDYAAVALWGGKKLVAAISVDQLTTQRHISPEQLEALRLFAGYAGLAIENARLHDALENDLSQRKSLIEELERKNIELERFTYTVSHDLKSPLVTITGFLGYLDRDARIGNFDHFKRDMNRIQQAVDKMQILLNDLLELSRIGRIMHEPVEEDFGAIVRDALSLLDGVITSGNIHVDFVDEGHKVTGDRVRLLEVIQNLVENAIKFMGTQPTPEIHIGSIKGDDGNPVFFVQDNGIGIEPQYQDLVFGIFNKLDAKSEGSGVGLTLVKRIIEVHKGRIWLSSQPGKGTTFFFTIPIANPNK